MLVAIQTMPDRGSAAAATGSLIAGFSGGTDSVGGGVEQFNRPMAVATNINVTRPTEVADLMRFISLCPSSVLGCSSKAYIIRIKTKCS